MQVTQLPIVGTMKIVPASYSDARGSFKETYSASRYATIGVSTPFLQDNISQSRALTLRGLHADPRMAKLVQVLVGKAFDVVVDIRPGSSTYRKVQSVVLAAEEHTQIYIPPGCLHGFLALEDDTILSYKQTAEYDPTTEFGVAWNDPDLAIDWPLGGSVPLLSPKDAANPRLRDLGIL